MTENRNHLVVNVKTTPAASVTERDAALDMLAEFPGKRHRTVGGNKGFDTFDFVEECRALNIAPHVAQNTKRPGGSAIDGRTTQHAGYALSQRKRNMIETTFG